MAKADKNMDLDVQSLRRKKTYKEIRKNLISQLKLKGAESPVFIDLVNDYMMLWITKEMVQNDIENNGIKVKYDNGGGQIGYKDNPSIDRIYKINAQMMKILSELKITTDKVVSEDNDEL